MLLLVDDEAVELGGVHDRGATDRQHRSLIRLLALLRDGQETPGKARDSHFDTFGCTSEQFSDARADVFI